MNATTCAQAHTCLVPFHTMHAMRTVPSLDESSMASSSPRNRLTVNRWQKEASLHSCTEAYLGIYQLLVAVICLHP